MFRAEYLLPQLERLPVYLLGFAGLALAVERNGEVTHARERARVLSAEHLLSQFERLPVHWLGLAGLALAPGVSLVGFHQYPFGDCKSVASETRLLQSPGNTVDFE